MNFIQYQSIGGMPKVEATPDQARLVARLHWHLEEFAGDSDRVRVIIDETGETGPWFSRRWDKLKFSQFWPAQERKPGGRTLKRGGGVKR